MRWLKNCGQRRTKFFFRKGGFSQKRTILKPSPMDSCYNDCKNDFGYTVYNVLRR